MHEHLVQSKKQLTDREVGKDGKRIATIEQSPSIEKNAKLIAASPFMLEILKRIAEPIGDEDLSDNWEWKGAAISDIVCSAIQISRSDE